MASGTSSTLTERGSVGHITVAGDETGAYEIIEKHPDGTMLIAPEPPVAGAYREFGLRPIGEAELERRIGPLGQPDDEG